MQIDPEILKYGAYAIAALGLSAVLTVVLKGFVGAPKPGQYRLAVTFMVFTLILAGAALTFEGMGKADDAEKLRGEVAALKQQVDDANAAKEAAVSQWADAKTALTTQVAQIATNIDGKWCVEIVNLGDDFVRDNTKHFIVAILKSITAIQDVLAVPENQRHQPAPECGTI